MNINDGDEAPVDSDVKRLLLVGTHRAAQVRVPLSVLSAVTGSLTP